MKYAHCISEGLETPTIKEQLDYLDDCNKKFKKKYKTTKSLKRQIIEDVLIMGFREFISISEKKNIDDDCTVRVYFYIQGLRDSIENDTILERNWKSYNEINIQVVDMIKIFVCI